MLKAGDACKDRQGNKQQDQSQKQNTKPVAPLDRNSANNSGSRDSDVFPDDEVSYLKSSRRAFSAYNK